MSNEYQIGKDVQALQAEIQRHEFLLNEIRKVLNVTDEKPENEN